MWVAAVALVIATALLVPADACGRGGPGHAQNEDAKIGVLREAVLAVFDRGQAKMATSLTGHAIQVGELSSDIVSRDVPRHLTR
jgi:hypothetical protein